jgi:colanic acid/amylovoran biosynthesis glycosyltransferase
MKKLNIAFALESYIRGHYTWIYNQYRFLKDIHVLILAKMLNPDRVHFQLNGHELFSFPGLEIIKYPKFHERIYRRVLRLLLVDSHIDLLVFMWKLKKSKCSLIHAHFAYVGWNFIPVAKILKIPLVVSFYGYDYDFLPNTQPKWKRRYKKLFQYGAFFLTEGEFGRKRLIKKGVPSDRVKVHHLGVDVETIPFNIRRFVQGETFRLVMIAGYVEKKGHRVLVETMHLLKIRNMISNISLTLIGNGPTKHEITDLIKKCDLEKYVTCVNYMPYNDLHQELLKYHVFIHPSFTTSDGDCEGGAPVVLLDAQATGMPVIATYHCDIPEEVLHRKTGLLVPENDVESLVDAILQFVNKPELLAKYGAAARKHVENNYSCKKQAENIYSIYADLIKG